MTAELLLIERVAVICILNILCKVCTQPCVKVLLLFCYFPGVLQYFILKAKNENHHSRKEGENKTCVEKPQPDREGCLQANLYGEVFSINWCLHGLHWLVLQTICIGFQKPIVCPLRDCLVWKLRAIKVDLYVMDMESYQTVPEISCLVKQTCHLK